MNDQADFYLVTEEISKESFEKYMKIKKDLITLSYQIQNLASIVQNQDILVSDDQLYDFRKLGEECGRSCVEVAGRLNSLNQDVNSLIFQNKRG